MRSGTDFDPLDLANQFMSPSLLPLAEYDALDPPCNALPLERDGHKTRGRWATFLVLEIRFQHVVPTACECFVILYLENVSLAEVDYATHLFLSGTHNGADAKIGSRDQHAASLRARARLYVSAGRGKQQSHARSSAVYLRGYVHRAPRA